jgi:hypothetical protein
LKIFTQDIFKVEIELQFNILNSVFALVEDSILLEVKSGPYITSDMREMAPWALIEDASGMLCYFNNLGLLVAS